MTSVFRGETDVTELIDPMDRGRFPVDPWRLTECVYSAKELGVSETLFSVGNGYLGMRGNVPEGRDSHAHGTFINGFHETWDIRHAEEAFGFAKVGQTIVNVPDSKIMRLYVDDEPLLLDVADLLSYDRTLDFATGVLSRDLIWQTPSGKRVHVLAQRMVSFSERHLAVMTFEVTMLDDEAPVVISSQVLNRQDGQDEYNVRAAAMGEGFDPRKAERFAGRVLQPCSQWISDDRAVLTYRCTNSGMTLAVAADHKIVTDNDYELLTEIDKDLAKHVYRVKAKPGQTISITKTVSYHTSRGIPPLELVDRCRRTLDRVITEGVDVQFEKQKEWLDDYWARTDIVIGGQPELQQAVRWNLFQLAQATARAESNGIPAKGLTGSGYGGHYFWDQEIYVLPYLTYTAPHCARSALRFRYSMLDAARRRAKELTQDGALFPWRTINGEEASAYYAAGTAQYHIDADIVYAVSQYVAATGDTDFMAREAIDILVETARMWADLGFWRSNGKDVFNIHGVTGPDEYTTVVDNNLYTNVMARFNLRRAVEEVEQLRADDPAAYQRMASRLRLDPTEVEEWARAAEGMCIPYDDDLGIHPQDAHFLERELWDLRNTPESMRPLLLHYHPLVIYRFQVLKQADVVLALFLQGEDFTPEEKLADFQYYDPITTGDSTLSAVVQSIIAAEVGYQDLALQYFTSSLFVDLGNLHHNTADGVHVASAGGIWESLVFGFGGVRDQSGVISIDPRLPQEWDDLTYRITLKGTRVRVCVRAAEIDLVVEEGDTADLFVRGMPVTVTKELLTITLDGQGPRIAGHPASLATTGMRRADGTVIVASVPHGTATED